MMSKPSKPSKRHHFVPQAQLRHFALDADRTSIWVFDKTSGRTWPSPILQTGMENHFNTVKLQTGLWNFENIFQDVDGRSASLISQIIERQSVVWLGQREREALIDLFTTQSLRTHFARTSPKHIATKLREMVRVFGYDPDMDPEMAMPNDASWRLGAVEAFLSRDKMARGLTRLVPVLFAAKSGQQFVLSDHPIAITNAFPYGDLGFEAHGVIILLPIAPRLAVALICPTIVSRYQAGLLIDFPVERRARLERVHNDIQNGTPMKLEDQELDGWNKRQIANSTRFLYSATDDFDFARKMITEHPEFQHVETHITIGEMGQAPQRKESMPSGLQLVIQGKEDHCMLPIAQIDKLGEGLTARTINVGLLKLIANDTYEIRAELYSDGHCMQLISAAMLECFGVPELGWFRIVHRDSAIRALARGL